MKVEVVTLVGALHTGGLPLAGRPKAITLRMLVPSQALLTPSAMQAGGMLPVLEVSGTSCELTPPGQSPGTRQMLIAPVPVPSVILPALLASKVTALTLLGTRMAVRLIE